MGARFLSAPWRTLLIASVLAVAVGACGEASPSGGGSRTASAVQGRFTVEFTVDQVSLRKGDAITGTATLRMTVVGQRALVSGAGDSLFGFEVAEVGGAGRAVTPVWRSDCAPHAIGSDVPITSPILKTGAIDGGPQSAFVAEYLAGPDVRLPPGDWDLSAVAILYDSDGCRGLPLTIRATVRVHVAE